MEVIEWVSPEQQEEREKYWIALFRAYGHRLVNHTDGGGGVSGWVPSEGWLEANRARGRARRGRRGGVPAAVIERRRAQGALRNIAHQKSVQERHEAAIARRKRAHKAPKLQSDPGLRGVYWRRKARKWEAVVHPKGLRVVVGRFDRPEEAGLARDIAAIMYLGLGYHLNYPPATVSAASPNFL